MNNHLDDKDFMTKMIHYPESQYATVKKFVEEYREIDDWNQETIEQRTKKLARLLYDNIIEG